MGTEIIPALIDRSAGIALFTLGTFMIAMHALLVGRAARQSALAPRIRALVPVLVAAFLALWLGIAAVVGDGLRLELTANERRLASLLVGFGPMILATALLFTTGTLRRINAATPPQWLIWIQTYRVVGLIFLFPFLYYGIVPAGFAIPAALGDIATGLAAPFVGIALARGRRNARAWAIGWNVFGLVDLIVAPAAAILTHAQVLDTYPLSLVPLFIGPPLGILTHIYSLRNLGVTKSGESALTSATVGPLRAT